MRNKNSPCEKGLRKKRERTAHKTYCLTKKGIAYYLAMKHGLCPKVKDGYNTTVFDEFWEEFEAVLLKAERPSFGADGSAIPKISMALAISVVAFSVAILNLIMRLFC